MERVRSYNLRPALDMVTKGRVGLGALAGLSLASTMANEPEDADHADNATLTEKLLAHSTRFQAQLSDMSEEGIAKLSSFVADALNVLNRASTT